VQFSNVYLTNEDLHNPKMSAMPIQAEDLKGCPRRSDLFLVEDVKESMRCSHIRAGGKGCKSGKCYFEEHNMRPCNDEYLIQYKADNRCSYTVAWKFRGTCKERRITNYEESGQRSIICIEDESKTDG
jgi:hypothetical protein